jgi:hypothetical protein
MQTQPQRKNSPLHDTPLKLFSKYFLDLTDLFLNLTGHLFDGALGFQLRIIGYFPGSQLDFTFHLVKLAFRLVSLA